MVGKSNSSAPKAPDPNETAAAEARFNRVDTYSPGGSGVRHGYTDANGQFQQGVAPEGMQSAQTYVESDTERRLRTMLEPASEALTGRIVEDNIINMPNAARVQDRGNVANDVFNRNFSLMAPQIEKSHNRLLTNLQGRGIPIGSEAFNDAYGEQVAQTNDTIARMAMDANLAAGQEQSRQFSLDSSARSGAISELVAAMGGGYNPPNSQPSGSAAGVNYSGLVGQQYQNEMAAYQQNQQQSMQTAGALGSLGSMLIKSSKHAKHTHGHADLANATLMLEDMPVYAWSYLPNFQPPGDNGALHVGPMAEDWQRITGFGDGKTINTIDYLGVILAALKAALIRINDLEQAVFDLDDFDEAGTAAQVMVH